jgi:hypothetical protein
MGATSTEETGTTRADASGSAFEAVLDQRGPADSTGPVPTGLVPAGLVPTGRAMPAPPPLDFSGRPAARTPKASLFEWIALVLAVVVPPLGLVTVIVARFVATHRHGWTTTVSRVATVVAIVLTIVAAGGGVAYSIAERDAAAVAQTLAEAQPLCAAIDATPGVLETQAFGWPIEVTAIPQTLEAMKAYQAHWIEVADVAPAVMASNVAGIVDEATRLVTSVETTQSIDRQGNLAAMTTAADGSGLASWHAEFCG